MIFDTYETLALACLVLLLGYFLVKRIKIFSDFNIPEPVIGGFIVAIVLMLVHRFWQLSFTFDRDLQTTMMLVFFTSIGLSANFLRLVKGGKPLVIFLFVSACFIALQNIVGILGTMLFGLDPAYGFN